MSRQATMLCTALFACTAPVNDTAPTGSPVYGVAIACTVQVDNVLRYNCVATTERAQALTVSISEGGQVLRTLAVMPSATEHRFVAYGMPPLSEVTVRALGDAGNEGVITLQTGALPEELTAVIRTTGETDIPYVFTLDPCVRGGALLILDGDGRVHWYAYLGDGDYSGPGGPVDAFERTDRDSVLVVTGKNRLREIRFDGERTADLRLDNGDFPRPLHHSLHWTQGYLYALNAQVHEVDDVRVVVDGVTVFDTDFNVVAEFDLYDHYVPERTGISIISYWTTVFPNAEDWSHGNHVSRTGDSMQMSFRHLDAVIDVVADPDSADFGQINWVLTGSDASSLESDYSWTDGGLGAGFTGQHHTSIASDGTLLAFDNNAAGPVSSGIRIALGDTDAQIVQRWPLDRNCTVQGAVFPVDGGALLTCGDARHASLRTPEGVETWNLSLSCPESPQGPLSRVVPVLSF